VSNRSSVLQAAVLDIATPLAYSLPSITSPKRKPLHTLSTRLLCPAAPLNPPRFSRFIADLAGCMLEFDSELNSSIQPLLVWQIRLGCNSCCHYQQQQEQQGWQPAQHWEPQQHWELHNPYPLLVASCVVMVFFAAGPRLHGLLEFQWGPQRACVIRCLQQVHVCKSCLPRRTLVYLCSQCTGESVYRLNDTGWCAKYKAGL